MNISGYNYSDPKESHTATYLWPTVSNILNSKLGGSRKLIFEVGCGNGAFAKYLNDAGFEVAGVDPSERGIREARKAVPHCKLQVGSTDEDLMARFGTFPIVISLEVVEHVFNPRVYAKCVFDLVEPGGCAIISTPYHSYVKNLALAMTGKMDAHFTALWDFGHIKFWSIATLTRLLVEVGFQQPEFYRVGRVAPLAKSMIAVTHKPEQQAKER